MKKPYERVVSYHFEVGGIRWGIVAMSPTQMLIEELDKNGQEDTHVSADLKLADGLWQLCDDRDAHDIDFYHGKGAAGALVMYINEHGAPQ